VGRTPTLLAALALLAGGCAGPTGGLRRLSSDGLGERLAARAASWAGHREAFTVAGHRFRADCSGFVAAVYQAEGVPFGRLLLRVSPRETSSAAAAYQAVKAYGVTFGGGGEWPEPGDLIFFHDTYDRDRDGRADDRFTHVGVVEYVSKGTVVFLHRGSRGVVRAAMNPAHPDQEVGPDGVRMNSPIRDHRPPLRDDRTLAGQLFAGYGRIVPERLPEDLLASRR
jgi:hypothetical protein